MNNCDPNCNCNCSSTDDSDYGDDTSTYNGKRQRDTSVPEPPDPDAELDYLVRMSEQENDKFCNLVNAATSKTASRPPPSSIDKRNAVNAIMSQHQEFERLSKKSVSLIKVPLPIFPNQTKNLQNRSNRILTGN